jgi:hypothetical protein
MKIIKDRWGSLENHLEIIPHYRKFILYRLEIIPDRGTISFPPLFISKMKVVTGLEPKLD